MKVLQNQDMQVSGISVDADSSPQCVLARELREILDGCPICQSSFCDYSYCILATVVVNNKADDRARLAQFLQCLRDGHWHEVLGFRQWIAYADTIIAFAFRCDRERVGIVSVFSPADTEAPDEPLHFTILSLEEGKKLLAVIDPENWTPLRPMPHLTDADLTQRYSRNIWHAG